MNADCLWVSWHDDILARGYADQGMFEKILDRTLWTPQFLLTFIHHEVRGDFPDVEGALVMLPARHHASDEDVERLKRELDKLKWCLLFLCGDEEWTFPWAEFPETPTRKVWIMQPRPEHTHLSGLFPGGWYPNTRSWIVKPARRLHDIFFAGQVRDNSERILAVKAIRQLSKRFSTLVHETQGYMQGWPRDRYLEELSRSKVVPSPSGPFTTDTARPLEAMEVGCVPVCGTVTPRGEDWSYWDLLFGAEHPIPTVREWKELRYLVPDLVENFTYHSNRVYSFWQQQKRRWAYQLDDDIKEVMTEAGCEIGTESVMPDDLITIVISTSPAPIHPSIDHISQVIASVRERLPRAEILIACDGVRPEDEPLRDAYNTYLAELLWAANFCVTGDTSVQTPEGPIPIEELSGTTATLLTRNPWSPKERGRWSEAPIRSYGVHPVTEICMSRWGVKKVVKATQNHRWFVYRGKRGGQGIVEVTTEHLRPGDKFASVFPPHAGSSLRPSPYGVAHGLTFGDGSLYPTKGTGFVRLYGKDRDLYKYFPSECPTSVGASEGGVPFLEIRSLPRGFKSYPSLEESTSYLAGWLAGYLAADGSVSERRVRLHSGKKEHLEFAAIIAARLGIATRSPISSKQSKISEGAIEEMWSMAFVNETIPPWLFLHMDEQELFGQSSPGWERRSSCWGFDGFGTSYQEEVFCATVQETGAFALSDWLLTGNSWHNVLPVVMDEFLHQANAVKKVLPLVRTPYVLFLEHDTPIEGEIPFLPMCEVLATGEAMSIRLHFDIALHPDHEPLHFGNIETLYDVPLRRIRVWWARPFLTRLDYLTNLLTLHFNEESRTFLEDKLYSILHCDWEDHGEAGWEAWRIWTYMPDGDIKRSGHLDSRGSHKKHEMVF